jgi:hypothetical protein
MAARISGKFILTGEVNMASDDPELLFERVIKRRLQSEITPEDCPDAGILAAFHEGTLSNDETSACKMHITKCARCRSVIEALETSDEILSPGQEYVPSADAATPEVLGYGAGDRKSVRHFVRPFKWRLMPATLAVAAGVLVLIGILVIRQSEKGPVQVAMNKTPIEKPEKRSSPGGMARTATEMPSHKKAELKTEEESRLKSKDIKHRLRPDILDSDAGKHSASKIAGERKYETAQLGILGKDRYQREALEREKVDSPVSKDSVPVTLSEAEAPPKHVSSDIADEFKVVLDRDRVAGQIIGAYEDLHKALSDDRAKRMDKELPIVPSIRVAKQEEFAETGKQFLAASPDPNVQWRFGAGGLIEKSIDSGKSWKRQLSNVTDDLLAGVVPSEKVCWLAGKNGTVLLTTDGEHWTRLPFPSKIDLGGIASKDALHTLVWDTQNKVKFSTEDGGNTWTEATGTAEHAP